jgi:hypothetical protein
MHCLTKKVALAVTLATILAGSEGAAQAAGRSTGGRPPCPTVADIQAAIGFPVRSRPVPVDGCLYELTGQYQGVMVSLMYQPATRAEAVYADVRQGVKAKGPSATPDKLTVGEGGLGYSSRGRKVAAAVSRGRLYHVEIEHDLFESLKLKDDVATKVIELAMRTAPGMGNAAPAAGKGAASLDACTLATNAEVAQAAEEKKEFAQYWSAPVSSFGGSHCDYEGGSIRVYLGASASTNFESMLKSAGAEKAARTPVSGIGDRAVFLIPNANNPYKRLGLLAVYSGSRVIQLTLDAKGQEPIEATRPRLERLAKLVLPRVP